jgi:phospholipase, patatin family
MDPSISPFSSCLLFSGGGTRFALYNGMYAALQTIGKTPNLLIASCGGAFASLVINAFSNDKERKAYLQSEEFYQFIKSLSLTPYSKLYHLGFLALQKRYDKRRAPFIEDVYHRYLVQMKEDLTSLLPSLAQVKFSATLPTIIIGSKMLFAPSECGKTRGDRKLYQKVFFTDPETAQKINLTAIQNSDPNYTTSSAIAPDICVKTEISILTAARISISDMFYVSPVYYHGEYYAGGAIDLIPMELANILSTRIIAEQKQAYSPTEEALVRAVLGFSGNERLASIASYPALWVDTRKATTSLKGFCSEKYIDWKRLSIGIRFPKDYQEYREQIDKQWDYGYQTILNTLTQ